jgi:glutathione-regulated potassium-efflux system ancillary protein KefG
MQQLLAPIEQTARLCGMDYLPPFVVHGTHQLGARDIERHGEDYRGILIGLRDGTLDLTAARDLPRLNHELGARAHG